MGEEIRKQRKKNTGVSKTSFDELADDLKIDVFRRLDVKDRGKLKCVSKAWRLLMAASCILMYAGLLYKYEHVNKPLGEVFHMPYESIIGRSRHRRYKSVDSILSFKLTRELQESCNGLLLLCHSHYESCVQVPGVAGSRRSYYTYYNYYVLNPLTKQFVKIAKPKQNSGSYKYAALAYHPAESSNFKIVRFRVKYLDVYSSETGKWISSRVQLRENVLRAKWVKQCVYFEGSIYRLSMSGHILRFVEKTNKKATEKSWMVQEIEIPETAKMTNEAACIGLSNGQIKFATSDSLSLKIWELNNKAIASRDYQRGSWSLKFSCQWNEISGSYISPAKLLSFHPHLDAIIVGLVDHKRTSFRCIHYSEKTTKSCQPTFPMPIRSRWGENHKSVFPLFQSEAPFANEIAT